MYILWKRYTYTYLILYETVQYWRKNFLSTINVLICITWNSISCKIAYFSLISPWSEEKCGKTDCYGYNCNTIDAKGTILQYDLPSWSLEISLSSLTINHHSSVERLTFEGCFHSVTKYLQKYTHLSPCHPFN